MSSAASLDCTMRKLTVKTLLFKLHAVHLLVYYDDLEKEIFRFFEIIIAKAVKIDNKINVYQPPLPKGRGTAQRWRDT